MGWGDDVPVQEDDVAQGDAPVQERNVPMQENGSAARDQPNVFMQFLLEFNRENASPSPPPRDAQVATLAVPGPSAATGPLAPGRAIAVS
ncbi:MAG: hypothetical protein ACP5VR_04560 [Acidimicrobiales bacterium]